MIFDAVPLCANNTFGNRVDQVRNFAVFTLFVYVGLLPAHFSISCHSSSSLLAMTDQKLTDVCGKRKPSASPACVDSANSNGSRQEVLR